MAWVWLSGFGEDGIGIFWSWRSNVIFLARWLPTVDGEGNNEVLN
jgi:hypothetical protein